MITTIYEFMSSPMTLDVFIVMCLIHCIATYTCAKLAEKYKWFHQ